VSIREKLNNNPSVTVCGAIVVLASAAFLIYQLDGTSRGGQYFYDQKKGVIVVMKERGPEIKPTITNKGEGTRRTPNELTPPTKVRAAIFACGGCGNYAGMTSEEIAKTGAKLQYVFRRITNTQVLATEPGSDKWLSMDDTKAKKLMREPKCPSGRKAEFCTP
jgi:hypothetical protein